MFTLTFVRRDHKPNEIYYYQKNSDAIYHFQLFKDDDSGLYHRILLEDESQLIDTIDY